MNENNATNNNEETNGWSVDIMEIITCPFFTEAELDYYLTTTFRDDSNYSEEIEVDFLQKDINQIKEYLYKIESSPRKYLHLINPTTKTIEQIEEIKKLYTEMIPSLQNSIECLGVLIESGKNKINEEGDTENRLQTNDFADDDSLGPKTR